MEYVATNSEGLVSAVASGKFRNCTIPIINGDEVREWLSYGYTKITVEGGEAVRDESEAVDREPSIEERITDMEDALIELAGMMVGGEQ